MARNTHKHRNFTIEPNDGRRGNYWRWMITGNANGTPITLFANTLDDARANIDREWAEHIAAVYIAVDAYDAAIAAGEQVTAANAVYSAAYAEARCPGQAAEKIKREAAAAIAAYC